jgi:periplasmic protein TonB
MSATLQFRSAPTEPLPSAKGAPRRDVHFDLLDDGRTRSVYGSTFVVSLIAHVALISAAVIVPLLFVADELVPPTDAVRAFFAAPPAVTPPPPPPPPPAAGAVVAKRAPVTAPTVPPPETAFRAPVDVPDELPKQEAMDLGTGFGVEGGVDGGVEGGVVGGIVGGVTGGVIGGVPVATPPPIRIGGNVKAPKMVRRVAPVYPGLAARARVQGIVVLEAQVDAHGVVTDVRVLRPVALLDEAAVTAVRQWRYQPLLLNGLPTAFVMVVTVNFNLNDGPSIGAS